MATTHDLDNLREAWQKIDYPHTSPIIEPDTLPGRIHGKRKNLLRVFFAMMLTSIVCAVALPWLVSCFFPTWLTVYMTAFFILAALLDYILIYKLRNIEFGEMTILESIHAICNFKKLRSRIQILCIALDIPLICAMMFCCFEISYPMFAGCIVGAVMGTIAGLEIDRKIRKEIKHLTKLYEDCLDS